jgi:small-conductance mechanosensitive channel
MINLFTGSWCARKTPGRHLVRWTEFGKLLVLVFLLSLNPITASCQENDQPQDSIPESIEPIPLIDIPQSAVDIKRQIRDRVEPKLQQKVADENMVLIDSLNIEAKKFSQLSDQFLEDQLSFSFYRSLLVRWSRFDDKIQESEKKVRTYSSDLQELKYFLDQNKNVWIQTRSVNLDEDSPAVLITKTNSVIQKIDSVSLILKERLTLSINVLDKFSELRVVVEDYKSQMGSEERIQLHQLLKVKSDPIWSDKSSRGDRIETGSNKSRIQFETAEAREYIDDNEFNFLKLGIIFSLILFFVVWLKKQSATLIQETQKKELEVKLIVSKPFSFALMASIIWAIVMLPEMPYMMEKLFSVLFLLPFLLFFNGITKKRLKFSLYYFSALFIFTIFFSFFSLGYKTNRFIVLLEGVLIALYFYWFIRNKGYFKIDNPVSAAWYRFLNFVSPLFLAGAVFGIVLNVFGYEYVSRVIFYEMLASVLLALILGVAYLFSRGLLLLFFDTHLAKLSNIIRTRKDDFLRVFDHLAKMALLGIWVYYFLRNILVWDLFANWIIHIWNISYNFGSITVTVGGIISFFAIIIFSWLISELIKIILQEEILDRFKLPRGVPMAIASLTKFSLVVAGFLLALAHAGFDIGNLGILAGALGIGIGFGMQNLVSNFISGLILIFERPVTVGDKIIIDGYEGTVAKIRIRSSVIKQWDGLSIIVPNSDLISKKVLNWSLDNSLRRFTVKIQTATDADPDQVLRIIGDAMKEMDNVLKDPSPRIVFQGVQNKSFQFDISFWVSETNDDILSDVNLAIQRGLHAKEIKIL